MLGAACGQAEDGDRPVPYGVTALGDASSGDAATDDPTDASESGASENGGATEEGGAEPGENEDDGGEGDDNASGDDGVPPGGSTGGSSDDDPPATTGNGGMDPVAECVADAVDACEACGCGNCLAPFDACQADAGCVAIRECATQADCAGIACAGPCGDTINDHGGVFGASLAILTTLGECMDAGCPGCTPGS